MRGRDEEPEPMGMEPARGAARLQDSGVWTLADLGGLHAWVRAKRPLKRKLGYEILDKLLAAVPVLVAAGLLAACASGSDGGALLGAFFALSPLIVSSLMLSRALDRRVGGAWIHLRLTSSVLIARRAGQERQVPLEAIRLVARIPTELVVLQPTAGLRADGGGPEAPEGGIHDLVRHCSPNDALTLARLLAERALAQGERLRARLPDPGPEERAKEALSGVVGRARDPGER